MPGNIRTVSYTRGDGRRCVIRLRNAWASMHARVRGTARAGNGSRPWIGLEVADDFCDWSKFRRWALEHGYKKGMTLERRDGGKGYTPSNCEWITRAENSRRARQFRARMRRVGNSSI